MIEIKQFQDRFLEDSSKLFCDNFSFFRQNISELPKKYGSPDTIIDLLKNVAAENLAYVALSEGELVGYMTGYTNIPSFKGSHLGVYVPEWAHSAVLNDQRNDIYYQLYKKISKKWVEAKNYTQAITYFANDNKIHKLWQRLGFGMLVIDGIRSLNDIHCKKKTGVKIRQAQHIDLNQLNKMDQEILDHLNQAPIFLNRRWTEKSTAEVEEIFLNEDSITFIAEKNSQIVSCIRAKLNGGNGCDIVKDNGTLGINFAFTYPDYRGEGLASLLLERLLIWGSNNNMKRCSVDFESMNREAYNFWLKNFKPVCYSSIRKIDDRITL